MSETARIKFNGPPGQSIPAEVGVAIAEAMGDDAPESGSVDLMLEPGAEYSVAPEVAAQLVESSQMWTLVDDGGSLESLTVKQLDALATARRIEEYPASGNKAAKIAAIVAAQEGS